MKDLYVHIGTGKTGTTAIQTYLRTHQDLFRDSGLNYVSTGLREIQHHALCLNRSARGEGGEVTDAFLKRWEDLRAELRASDLQAHVISSENFPGITSDEVKRIVERLDGVANVHMIVYFRRQDLYLESWYAQVIKAGQVGVDLRRLGRRLRRNGTFDFFGHAVKWAEHIGDDRVHVRPYEREAFKCGDLLEDFLAILGLKPPIGIDGSTQRSNPSLTRPQIEVIKALHQLGSAKKLGDKLTRPHHLFGGCDKNFLSVDERLALLDEYAESNAQLARRFLGREDGRLFTDTTVDFPRSDPDPETVLAFLRDVLEVSDATARGGDQHDIGG